MRTQSQRDTRWANEKLGFSDTTIGDYGCTITSIANILDLTPTQVNERLKSVNGFLRNLVIWGKLPEAFPQIKSATRYWSYDNDIALSNLPVLVEVSGAKLNNPNGKHWVVFIGNKQMVDPWTGVTKSSGWYGDPTGMTVLELQSTEETMADTLPVKKDVYEMLVSKASKYDEIKAEGIESATDVLEMKKEHRDKVKSLQEASETCQKSVSGFKGEITKLQKKIADLEAQDNLGLAKRFSSRKFLVAILAVLLPVINKQTGLDLDPTELIVALTPILAFIGVEGFTDYKDRLVK